MNLPSLFRVVIITLSDRASRGEYADLSGPKIKELLLPFLEKEGWIYEIRMILIGDEKEALERILKETSQEANIILTTGGTGIGPRDITVETVRPLLDKEIPGVMEYIRMKYGAEKPNALLSRGVAGVMGKALVYTLPGSVRAVSEYMEEILKTVKHTVQMLYSIDSHSGS
jgi:molybdenum cofactor synthesis domain-containing protein